MTYRCVFFNDGIMDFYAESLEALFNRQDLPGQIKTVMVVREDCRFASLFAYNWQNNYVSIWDARNIPDADGELGW